MSLTSAYHAAVLIYYVGNFEPEHSTENHIKRALLNNGHNVIPWQENDPNTFETLALGPGSADLILWTRTGWNWHTIYQGGEMRAHAYQRQMLRRAFRLGIPVVGYHLDIWWGLKRVEQVYTEPFFESNLLITADGGHDDKWEEAGVNHVWFPPGVSRDEAKTGMRKTEFVSDLAFVGSWEGGYHPESEHRHALVKWLRSNFRTRCAFYPKPGHHSVRGKPLQDLYRSTKVVVGDSCFTGTGLANYWSDRVPETLGRGGLLLHPNVPGLEKHYTDGMDLLTWDAWDFDALGSLIETTLSDERLRDEIRHAGRQTVLQSHTYEYRMIELMNLLEERNML